MDLRSLLDEFHQALADEIVEARQGRGQQHRLRDGHCLGEHAGGFLYTFAADFEIFVPDDSPIELKAGTTRVSGVLVAIEGLTVLLELSDDLGELVPRAELRTEPWYLLEALQQRLQDGQLPGATSNPKFPAAWCVRH